MREILSSSQPYAITKTKIQTSITRFALAQTRSKYAIRIDNTDEIETLDLRPYNALPASTYQYTAGQRLMILDGSSTSDKQNWVDATVVNSRGKQHGSRHRIRAELSGKEMEFDLNRFNHAVQAFETVGHFFALRTEYFDHLRETERTVCTCTHTLPPHSLNSDTPCVDCFHASGAEGRTLIFLHIPVSAFACLAIIPPAPSPTSSSCICVWRSTYYFYLRKFVALSSRINCLIDLPWDVCIILCRSVDRSSTPSLATAST